MAPDAVTLPFPPLAQDNIDKSIKDAEALLKAYKKAARERKVKLGGNGSSYGHITVSILWPTIGFLVVSLQRDARKLAE